MGADTVARLGSSDMERLVRWLAVLLAASVLAVACSSDEDPDNASGDAPVIGDATPTAVATDEPAPAADEPEEPTPEPAQLTDQELVDVALAAFDAERGDDYLAWDFLGSQVDGDTVSLELCAWTGETVYDEVLDVTVSVAATANGVEPRVISAAQGEGDCLNTELIDSAFAFIDEHDEYWTGITSDPTTFDPTVRAPEIFTPGNLELATDLVNGWVEDGVHWVGLSHVGDLPESAVVEVLGRRYEGRRAPVIELLACREMDPSSGLYRGALLLEDFKGPSDAGTHSIITYFLIRTPEGWRVSGTDSVAWADCFFAEDWLEGMNSFDSDPVQWEVIAL